MTVLADQSRTNLHLVDTFRDRSLFIAWGGQVFAVKQGEI